MDTPDHLDPIALAAENLATAPAAIVEPALYEGLILDLDGPALRDFWAPHLDHVDFVSFLKDPGFRLEPPLPSWLQNGVIAFLQKQILQWELNDGRSPAIGDSRVTAAKQTARAQARLLLDKIIRAVSKKPTTIKRNGKAFLIDISQRHRIDEFRRADRGRLPIIGDPGLVEATQDSGEAGDLERPDRNLEHHDDVRVKVLRLLHHPEVKARPVVRRLIEHRIKNGGIEARANEAAAIGVSEKVIKQARAFLNNNWKELWA